MISRDDQAQPCHTMGDFGSFSQLPLSRKADVHARLMYCLDTYRSVLQRGIAS